MMLNSPYTADQMGLMGLRGLGDTATAAIVGVDCSLPGTENVPLCRAKAAGDVISTYWPVILFGIVGFMYISMRGRY